MKKAEKTMITRAKIMKLATEEFGIKGYKSASISNICAQGIAKGLLYHNYHSKDELYLALVQKCYAMILQYFIDNRINNSLNHYLDLRIKFMSENPYESRIILETVIQPNEKLQKEIMQIRQEYDHFNRQYFSQLIDTLTLRPNITKQKAIDYFETMQTMFNVYFSNDFMMDIPFDKRIEMHEKKLANMLDVMLYGIAD